MRIRGGGATNVGNTRAVNQDAIYCRLEQRGRDGFSLLAVCDGVGGLEHGELASSFLVEQMEHWFQETLQWIDMSHIDGGVLFSHLKDAAENWNEEIRQLCRERNLKTGSTMSLLLVIGESYYIIHVGDSRIYRCRGNDLEQLTVDASVARLKNGQMKNYLSNYMGKEEDLWFQALEGRIEDGDLFVVCSDGFYHRLTKEDVADLKQIFRRNSKIDEICDRMIRVMMERGESDNISMCALVAEQRKGLFG